MDKPFTFGTKVKCKLTGFTGTVTGWSEYDNGCVTVRVTSAKLKDGAPHHEWFDVPHLEVVKAVRKKTTRPTGGPRTPPPSRTGPH